MFQVYMILFLAGIVLVAIALYRGRDEIKTAYSWLSYVSLILPMTLLVSLFFIPQIPPTTSYVVEIFFLAIFIGGPTAFIFSLAALFKKKEKNLLAIFGMFLSLILLGTIIILILFLVSSGNP